MVLGGLVLIYGFFRHGRFLLQALRDLIAALLGLFLFGGPRKPKKDEEVEEEKVPPPRPFASYVNPFDAGLDHQFGPNDLVIYSFEASKRGPTRTNWRDRPTRLRPSSSNGSVRRTAS